MKTAQSKNIFANLQEVGRLQITRALGKLCNTLTDTLASGKMLKF